MLTPFIFDKYAKEIGDKVAANHEGYIVQDQSHYVLLSATSLWTRYFGGASANGADDR